MAARRRSAWSAAVVLPSLALVAAGLTPGTAVISPRCPVPDGVRAGQVVLVEGDGTRATVTACRRQGDGGYVAAMGPWRGRVGSAGVAPAGAKREGDRRTPSGVFPLRGAFGAGANPGVRVGWLRVDGADVWVDDSRSRLYNTRQRLPARGRWRSAERLAVPAYRYAQVVGYNERRVRGLGSAIFLHLDTGRATAGCVAVPSRALLALLRWQEPGAVMVVRPG